MNPSRIWLDREVEAFARSLPDGATVLDAGSGDQVYRAKFAGKAYESADFEQVDKPYASSTYVCDLAAIPVGDSRYDAVLFTQVMEHLPEPRDVVRELYRVLKPGGRLFYSGPLFYEEHEVPYDFFRYTQFGVRSIFEGAGFIVVELRWLEGYMGTLHYQLTRMAKHVRLSPGKIGGGPLAWLLVAMFAVLKPILRLAASLAKRCDIRVRYRDTGFPINYVAVVQKPAHAPVAEGE